MSEKIEQYTIGYNNKNCTKGPCRFINVFNQYYLSDAADLKLTFLSILINQTRLYYQSFFWGLD